MNPRVFTNISNVSNHMKWRALYLVIFFLSRSYIYTYKKTREKERNREKGRSQERKREKGRENEVNYYQSAFNSQKEKLKILAEMLQI